MIGLDQGKEVDKYFSTQSSEYSRKSESGFWRVWKETEYNTIIKHLGSVEGCRVLDLGCGKGWYARRLMAYRPSSYLAVDRVSSMVANEKIPGVSYLIGDIQRLPLQASFDRILCAGVLEFVSDPESVFSETSALLSSNGVAVFLAPSDTMGGRLYRWWHAKHGFRINLFSTDYFAKIAKMNGLTLRSVTPLAFNYVVSFSKS